MDKVWIWFKLLPIDNSLKLNLLQKYSIEQIYNKRDKFLDKYNIQSDMYMLKSEKIVKYNEQNGIGVLHLFSRDYPQLLKRIYNPPIVLYWKGKKELLNKNAISMFTGKEIDTYGKKILKQLTNNLVKNKVCLVTKFEEYDKNIFFKNTNNENILVLSSGIKENVYSRGGVVISEYEPYINSSREQILKRNRIITGLTYETVLLQMTINDGVIYVVDLLLEQNREMWVVPGDITKYQNIYTNELIKQGANVLTEYNQLWVYEQNLCYKNMSTANKY